MWRIRRATARDSEQIARLAAQSAIEEGAQSALDSDRVKAHAFGQTPLFEAWVAEQKGAKPSIGGHAAIAKSYDFRRAAPTIRLCELYVSPDYRRDGLARLLMSAVARRAMEIGARELVITTGVENEVAQKFFAAVGARRRDAAVFQMSADGIEWLATEAL